MASGRPITSRFIWLHILEYLEYFFFRTDIHPCRFILWNFIICHIARWFEQIRGRIKVNLCKTDLNLNISLTIKHLFHCTWYNSLVMSHHLICWTHGEGFSTSCLSIREYTHIVSFQKTCYHLTYFWINFCLRLLAFYTLHVGPYHHYGHISVGPLPPAAEGGGAVWGPDGGSTAWNVWAAEGGRAAAGAADVWTVRPTKDRGSTQVQLMS